MRCSRVSCLLLGSDYELGGWEAPVLCSSVSIEYHDKEPFKRSTRSRARFLGASLLRTSCVSADGDVSLRSPCSSGLLLTTPDPRHFSGRGLTSGVLDRSLESFYRGGGR
jgi:hypothetical protein